MSLPAAVPHPASRGRLPGLDGLRALAVLLVLVAHFLPVTGVFFRWLAITGTFGVQVFFVLSGFLITHLLIREESRNGGVRLPLFYARRTLRILPPLAFYLSFLFVADRLGWIEVPGRDFLHSVLFLRNFFGVSPETAHLWTLAIEEQFYLIWPAILLLTPPGRQRLIVAGSVAVLGFLWGDLAYRIPAFAPANSWRTDLRLVPLMCGALTALVREHPGFQGSPWACRLGGGGAGFLGLFLVFLTPLIATFNVPILRFFIVPIGCAAVVLLVLHSVDGPGSALVRALEWRWVRTLGTLSYSLYLGQQCFAGQAVRAKPAWFRELPQALVFVALFAVLCHGLAERPLLALRRRLRPGGEG